MSNETSYSLSTTPSTIEKRLQYMESLTAPPTDINKMVNAAHQKLSPIIESVIQNSRTNKSSFITKNQFEDTIIASKIIGDVGSILKLDSVEALVNHLNFDLENMKVTVNSKGLIFVDTALLLQLIDLHTLLEEFLEYVDPADISEVDCLVQTDSYSTNDLSKLPTLNKSTANDPPKPPKLNKFTVKMTRPKNDSGDKITWPALTDFILLPSLEELQETDNESCWSMPREDCYKPHIERARSVGFLTEEETTDVTDVHGARNIIEKCMCDLERVQCFITKDYRKPVADICTDTRVERAEERRQSREEKQRVREEQRRKSYEERRRQTIESQPKTSDCCCTDSCADFNVDKEDMGVCGEDNVVICIKGRSPEDGDVQIVIKQCPDCRNACTPCASRSQTDQCGSADHRNNWICPPCKDKIPDRKTEESQPPFIQRPPNQEQESPPLIEETFEPDTLLQQPPSDTISQVSQPIEEPALEDRQFTQETLDGTSIASQITAKSADEPALIERRSTRENLEEPPLVEKQPILETLDKLSIAGPQPTSSPDRISIASEKSIKEPSPEPQESDVDILKKLSDLNVILPPVPLSETPKSPPEEKTEEEPKPSLPPPQQQFRTEMDCAEMQMYEAKKLCLNTEQGEELLITLTVTPRSKNPQTLFMKNLFSDEDSTTSSPEKSLPIGQTKPVFSPRNSDERDNDSDKRSLRFSEDIDNTALNVKAEYTKQFHKPLQEKPTTQLNYNAVPNKKSRVIPLERTKVCSSLEFDVRLVDTKIREKGIHVKNQSILVQLKDMGVDNLLRACRPAKCCRKAILNEKMKKYLPYSPSLKSLPLDEDDLKVINQSLQMSVQKVKNSTDLRDTYQEHHAYCFNKFKVMYSLVDKINKFNNSITVPERKKLSYYINLVNDEVGKSPVLEYNVLYFEVQKNTKELNKNGNADNNANAVRESRLKQEVNINVLEIVSDSINHNKEKYKFREDRPLISAGSFIRSMTNPPKSSIPKIFTETGPDKLTNPKCTGQQKNSTNKKNTKSKIPILHQKFCKNNQYNATKNSTNESEHVKKNNYLGYENRPVQAISKNQLLILDDDSRENLSGGSHSSALLRKRNSRNIIPRGKNSIAPSSCHCADDFDSSSGRRKNPEFYCLRSKSDISLNKNNYRSSKHNKKVYSNNLSVEKVDRASSAIQTWSNKNMENDKIIQNLATLVMQYLSEVVHRMLVNDLLQETKSLATKSSLVIKKNSIKNIQDLLGNSKGNHLKIHEEINCYAVRKLKSISSDKIFDDVENSLPIQTSAASQFETFNQECQTKSIANISKIKQVKPIPKVFNKLAYKEALMGFPNSSDDMENFVVVFRSDNSFNNTNPKIYKSNKLSTTDVLSTPSSTPDPTEESINQSLFKLKEALTDADNIMTSKTKHVIMNPVEYMVYQNYVKSSFFQKIINKSKGILRPGVNEEINGKNYCEICKCDNSECFHIQKPKPKPACLCPENLHRLPRKKTRIKKSKLKSKPGKSWCSLVKNKSVSSVKTIGSKIKKSITNILKRSKGQYVNMCAETKPCKNAQTMACSPSCTKFKHQKQEANHYDENLHGDSLRKNQHPKDVETTTRRLEMLNDTKINKGLNTTPILEETQNTDYLENKCKLTECPYGNKNSIIISEDKTPILQEKQNADHSENKCKIAECLDKNQYPKIISKKATPMLQEPQNADYFKKCKDTERPNQNKHLNVISKNESKDDHLEKPDVQIILDDCSCQTFCDQNDGNCCCDSCAGCSFNSSVDQDFFANYFAVDNFSKFLVATGKTKTKKFVSLGPSHQPLYSIMLPHNFFDINNDFGHNNPFQNYCSQLPQEQVNWQLQSEISNNIFENKN